MAVEYENYTDASSDDSFNGTKWEGQTFTPSVTHTISYVVLKMYKVNSPTHNITVSIRATSSDLPTGSDLCSATINASTLTTNSSGANYTFTFGTNPKLSAGTKYAICVNDSGDSSPNASVIFFNTSGSYSGGDMVRSTNSGSTWSFPGSGWDMYFQEWGEPSAIIHTMTATTASLSLSSQTTLLKRMIKMIATTASLTLTAMATSLRYAKRLIATTVTLTLTPFNTIFRVLAERWKNVTKSSTSSFSNQTRNNSTIKNSKKSTTSIFNDLPKS